jgi:hypothetical protein
MPLVDHRKEFSWPKTILTDIRLITGKKRYTIDEIMKFNLGFRTAGGLRESFIPDVWTMAWEDNDKLIRLTIRTLIAKKSSFSTKELARTDKEVRKAKFYWSRDPDLPYRIWPLIVPEDGSKPLIPINVEDAKAKMFDVIKNFEIPASHLGSGEHTLIGVAKVSWGRRSWIEKGESTIRSKGVEVTVE